MRLRQNVVLLRNGDEPDSFFPVCCHCAVSETRCQVHTWGTCATSALSLSVKHLSTVTSFLHVQRFQLMDTSSFRELDGGWRDRLAWLHDDYFYRRQVQCVHDLTMTPLLVVNERHSA